MRLGLRCCVSTGFARCWVPEIDPRTVYRYCRHARESHRHADAGPSGTPFFPPSSQESRNDDRSRSFSFRARRLRARGVSHDPELRGPPSRPRGCGSKKSRGAHGDGDPAGVPCLVLVGRSSGRSCLRRTDCGAHLPRLSWRGLQVLVAAEPAALRRDVGVRRSRQTPVSSRPHPCRVEIGVDRPRRVGMGWERMASGAGARSRTPHRERICRHGA